MKHFQYLFRLFVALTAILTARAVYAQQEVLPKIDVIGLDSCFDKLVPSNSPRPTAASRPSLWYESKTSRKPMRSRPLMA
jgi:hypothetical protein